ncbi:MAG: aa3-type cytochrome c oxidase subunit IV [Paracoccaceae bacterium]
MSNIKHENGKMNITDQKETFRRFISFGIYLFYASISAIIFLAIFNS